MTKITIIWWTAGFWEWLAKFLNEKLDWKIELTITWRDEERAKELAKKINCNYSLNNIEASKNADIVIFSVPIAFMEKTIEEVAPNMKTWSMIMDVCSIKKFPSIAMKKYAPEWVLVVPTHPMFWPFVSSIAGQIFVLTPEEEVKTDERYIFVKEFLKIEWAKVIESTPIEHDKMMAVVQWLTHFDIFVFWETIKRLWIDIEKSMNFVSPVYKIMISSVSRYMNQNPKLYSDIQLYNDEVLEVHKVFMQATEDFSLYVKNKNEDDFIWTIEETKKYFWENALKWQKYTDKIIYMLSKQVEKIDKNTWKEISLVNIYSWEKITWKLDKFEKDFIFIWVNKYNIDEWEII